MDSIFLTTAIIPRVCVVILYVVGIAYLLSLKEKSAATWWLVGFFVCFGALDVGWEIVSVIPLTQMSPGVYHLMFGLGQGLFFPTGLTFLQFAYTFRGNPYPRESRVLLLLMAALSVVVLLLIVFTPSYLASDLLFVIQIGILLSLNGICIWSAVVFLRKTLLFSRDVVALRSPQAPGKDSLWTHLRAPQGRSARACRVFAGLSLLLLVIIIGGTLVWGLGVFQEIGLYLYEVGYLAFLFSLFVAYVNYAPEPTSVQVKLVGAALVTVMLLFVVLTEVLFPDARMLEESGIAPPSPQTLRFEPDGGGGYSATAFPLRFDPAPGERLVLANDQTKALPLPFPFPYYDAVWNSLHVSDDGLVSFGRAMEKHLDWSVWPFFHGYPLIIPLWADLDPEQGGGVFFKATPDSATVTWHAIPLYNGTAPHTVQLVLYRTGIIAFRYVATGSGIPVSDPWFLGLRGLHPGGDNASMQTLPRVLDSPVRSAAGAALVEDYATQFYRYLERRGRPLLFAVVGTTLFILFVFPYIFRSSLLRPLDRLLAGVQHVEAGHTDTVVVTEVQDEIGVLTQHFNQMAYTIHRAEQQLKDYAETLELKVEARTAELARSLDELKAAQAQLIQAEKMASLGQLTAGIAHEIKNPLNFVNNFALLSTELTADLVQQLDAHKQRLPAEVIDDLQEMLDDLTLNAEKIHHHGLRADGIVQSMLAHARGGEGERRSVDVNALLDEYVNLAYHGMRAATPGFNATIERDYDEALGAVTLVPQDIGRVFLNLINNAFYAIHHRSRTANGAYVPTVRVCTRRRSDHLKIRVADNGPGIAEALRARVFEPFYTTKPTGTGTGLGLSISYDIVVQGHGGLLTVESTEGEGAAFIVTLPTV